MRSDNRAWLERLNLVECRNPLLSFLRIRLGKIEVNIVVGGIAGNHKPDRRNIQTGRMVRVGVTNFHNDQFIPFDIDYIPFELFGDHQLVWNLTRKSWLLGTFERLRRGILAHYFNRIGGRHYFGVGEPLEKSSDTEPMVSMAVGNVDGCQVLPLSCNPIC